MEFKPIGKNIWKILNNFFWLQTDSEDLIKKKYYMNLCFPNSVSDFFAKLMLDFYKIYQKKSKWGMQIEKKKFFCFQI